MVRVGGAGLFVAMLALVLGAGRASADISSSYQVNLAHTGVQTGDPLKPPLRRVWSVTPDGGDVSFAVTGGRRVFVLTRFGASTMLYALDGATGRRLWGPVDLGGLYLGLDQANQPSTGAAQLTYDGTRVYAQTSTGYLEAFNADTGARVWHVHVNPHGFTSFDRLPMVIDHVLYTQDVGSDGYTVGLYAFDPATGRLLWRTASPNFDLNMINAGPAYLNGTLYWSGPCGWAGGFQLATRTNTWNTHGTCSSYSGVTPVAGDGVLWRRPDETLSLTDGSHVRTLASASPPVIDGSLSIVRVGSTVKGENAQTGAVRWTFTGDGHLTGNLIAANGVVYVGSTSGTLYAVSESDGSEVWHGDAGVPFVAQDDVPPTSNDTGPLGDAYSGPSLAGGLLLFPEGPHLVAFRSQSQKAPTPLPAVARPKLTLGGTGASPTAVSFQIGSGHAGRSSQPLPTPVKLLWRRNLGGQIGYPLIVGGRVFVDTDSSSQSVAPTVAAYSISSGRLLWGPVVLPLADKLYQALAYDSGRLLVQTWSGDVRAYDSATGKLLWHEILPFNNVAWQFTTAPVAAQGTLYTSGAGVGALAYAINDRNGKLLWTYYFNWGASGAIGLTPRDVIVADSSLVRALDRGTGRLEWATPPNDNGAGVAPAIHNGDVYDVDGDYYNRILNARTGAGVQEPYSGSTTPVFDGNLKIVLIGRRLVAENALDPVVRWTFSGDGGLSTQPLIVGHRVYVGSSSGRLYGLNDATGALLWSNTSPAPYLSIHDQAQQTTSLVGLNAADGYLAAAATGYLSVYR